MASDATAMTADVPPAHARFDRIGDPRAGSIGRLSPSATRLLLAAFLLFAAALRVPDVWRPIDGSTWSQWREADVGSIARNFYREDPNPFRPRIDWRGDGPGLVESEFPLYPWAVSLLYRAFGYHEELARVLSFAISLASGVVFFGIARRLLPPLGLAAALLFFALNPLAVQMSTAVQPEPLMLLFYLLAIHAFLRWIGEGNRRFGVLAAAWTALAILAKAPAAHVGLLFAALCLDRHGWRAVLQPSLWLFAVAALAPPAAWYAFSHQYWLVYGNSLGMSNSPVLPIFSLSFPRMVSRLLPGLGNIELGPLVWTVPGALLAATALPAVATWPGRVVLYWIGALAIYYVCTIVTTGAPWAYYYHVVTVPPAALAIGLAIELHLRPMLRQRRLQLRGALAAGMLLAALALQVKLLRWQTHPHQWDVSYACAMQFQKEIPPGTRIAASGGLDRDAEWGFRIPGDAPHFFFWMDRQGFSIHEPDHTIAKLEEVKRHGARFFVAELFALGRGAPPGFEDELRRHYRLASECEMALLFDLGEPAVAASGPPGP